jgi:MscS family membrane protein
MTLGELSTLTGIITNNYARALIIFIGLFIISRLVLAIFLRSTIKLTSKTKTDVDDILVKKVSSPLTFIALLVSLKFGLAELALSEAMALSISRIIYSALIVVLGYLVFVVVDIVLVRGWKNLAKKSDVKVNESLTSLVHETLRIAVIILVLLYILQVWGIEVLPLLGALGVAGIAIALALQPVLSNIFSGVAMILDKSVRVGDWVVLEDKTWGVVQKIGIRSTQVKTFDNEMIIVPNSKMADSQIQNVSLPEPKARAVVPFSVAYGSDIDKVKKLIKGEIMKISHIVKEPEPLIYFAEMADSSLNFKAYVYVDSFQNRFRAIDEMNSRIYKALNKAGVEIPFPQMDVHLKNASKKSRS